jgi:hypothetical protein
MNVGAQGRNGAAAEALPLDLAGADRDGGRACIALECIRVGEALALVPDLRQQAWSELAAGSRQRAEEIAIRMRLEEFLDPLAVEAQLRLERAKNLGQRNRLKSLRSGDRL